MHATTVAWQDKAVLIIGQSGSGKSALGLQLLSYGCVLVADDRTQLTRKKDDIVANAPDTISGLIEARGVGILQAEHAGDARIVLVVDLDHQTEARLPPRRAITLLGCEIPLIYRAEYAHFSSAILQILKSGWSER